MSNFYIFLKQLKPSHKLAILTQYYYPETGAPQNRLYELATGLKNRGWEVSVITGMPNYPTGRIFRDYRWRFSMDETHDGINLKRYWLYASNSKRSFPRILSMISFSVIALLSYRFIKKEKFDYLFVESPPMTLGLTGVFLSRIIGTKLIFNASDLWPLSAKELGYLSQGRIYKSLEKLEKYIYRKSFLATGQSDETVRHLMEKGAERTFLFRNGVDPDRFPQTDNLHSSGKIKLVYAGLLGVAQGILEICETIDFADLGTEFHIYGDGVERDSLKTFLNLNPWKGVAYHGSVSRNEIPEILSKYDASLILLVKNIYGAVPSKIYESMAAGLPIIFSGLGEGRKIVEEYNLGWACDPRDHQGLSEIIGKLKTQKEEILQKRNNCLRNAREVFDRKIQINALHEYLSSHIDFYNSEKF